MCKITKIRQIYTIEQPVSSLTLTNLLRHPFPSTSLLKCKLTINSKNNDSSTWTSVTNQLIRLIRLIWAVEIIITSRLTSSSLWKCLLRGRGMDRGSTYRRRDIINLAWRKLWMGTRRASIRSCPTIEDKVKIRHIQAVSAFFPKVTSSWPHKAGKNSREEGSIRRETTF